MASPQRRCFGADDGLLIGYHDREWGRPVLDERAMYERLCLEAFQAGLSWRTVLHKRAALREVFENFEPRRVAAFGRREVSRLMRDERIIRNRAKIEATIANARTVSAMLEAGESLVAMVWAFAPRRTPAYRSFADAPAVTPVSRALSAALRAAGFRFVGPTTAYATMQAAGLVNDHQIGCPQRREVEAERLAALRSLAGESR